MENSFTVKSVVQTNEVRKNLSLWSASTKIQKNLPVIFFRRWSSYFKLDQSLSPHAVTVILMFFHCIHGFMLKSVDGILTKKRVYIQIKAWRWRNFPVVYIYFFSKVVSDLFESVVKCGHDLNQKNIVLPRST